MRLAPLDVAQVATRVSAQVPALRGKASGAAEFASAMETTSTPLPAAFVVLENERIDSGDYTEHGRLTIDSTVAVIVGVRNYRQQAGAPNTEDLRPILAAVRNALTGYTPTFAEGVRPEAMKPSGIAQLLRYDQSVMWWVERFTCQRSATA